MMMVICWLYGNAIGYAAYRYLSGFSARLSEQVLRNFVKFFRKIHRTLQRDIAH